MGRGELRWVEDDVGDLEIWSVEALVLRENAL
jgi:hypothetical protein